MKWLSNQASSYRLRQASLLLVGVLLGPILIFHHASADTIVQSFNVKSPIQPGWIVALDKKQTRLVEPTPSNDPSRIYGVVIDPSQAPVTLTSQSNQQLQAFVAVNGTYPVLVNTQNGTISPGDFISVSSTDGIGAKATSSQTYVLGQALQKFDGNNNVITGGNGGAAIGEIEVTILPTKNPLVASDVAVPSVLRRAGQAIAGKNVSAARIWAALAVFLIAAFVALSTLWMGIRSGMISIGRNPLSRHAIIQGLLQVVVVAVLVFVLGVVGVYLLLKL